MVTVGFFQAESQDGCSCTFSLITRINWDNLKAVQLLMTPRWQAPPGGHQTTPHEEWDNPSTVMVQRDEIPYCKMQYVRDQWEEVMFLTRNGGAGGRAGELI